MQLKNVAIHTTYIHTYIYIYIHIPFKSEVSFVTFLRDFYEIINQPEKGRKYYQSTFYLRDQNFLEKRDIALKISFTARPTLLHATSLI